MKTVKPKQESAIHEAPTQVTPEQVSPSTDGSKPIAPTAAVPKPLNQKPLAQKPEAKQDHDPAIRILKIGTCSSTSGKSTLTYHLGANADSAIQIRVVDNSGGGFFSPEWIALATIQEALKQTPDDQAITSFSLRGIFRGKSVNTAGFLMAVLKHEGLVKHMQEKQRCYESVDPAAFIAQVEALIKSSVDLPAGEVTKPSVASKKPVARGKPNAA
jgi:hypothetical protein